MGNPKISHEIPIALFPHHDFINEYAYVLAHLLLPEHYNEEYAKFYKQKLVELEYSILDNSLFELGDSIDYKELYRLGEEYKPSHIILPDCLHDIKTTKERAELYLKEFGDNSTPKFIAVLQGKSYEEIEILLDFYLQEDKIDIIAVPFDIMKPSIPADTIEPLKKIWRHKVVKECIIPYINKSSCKKKLHLLGCATPLEFNLYLSSELRHIYSVDTSAPIIYGWNNISLDKLEITSPKPKEKLAENLDIELNSIQLLHIAKNVHQFRELLKIEIE